MEEFSEYKDAMNVQGRRTQACASPLPQVENVRPSAQKNLGSLFGLKSNHYAVSLLCSRLNSHLPKGSKLDPSVPRTTLLDTIQEMVDLRQLPNDEIMEDVLAKTQANNNKDDVIL